MEILPHTHYKFNFNSLKAWERFCLLPAGVLISYICKDSLQIVTPNIQFKKKNRKNIQKKTASAYILWRDKLKRYVFLMHTALAECLLDINNDQSITEPLGTCFLAKLSFTTQRHKGSLHLIWIDKNAIITCGTQLISVLQITLAKLKQLTMQIA